MAGLIIQADVTEATYTDTADDDIFGNTAGQLSTFNSDPTAVYGIDGGASGGSTTVEGHTYDVSEAGAYGTLYLDSVTGAYIYVADDAATEGLKTTDSDVFTLSATNAAAATDSTTLTITLNGVNDAPVIAAGLLGDYVIGGYNSVRSSIALTLSDRDTGDTAVYDTAALAAAGWNAYYFGGYYKLGSFGIAVLNTDTNVVTYSLNYYALNGVTFEDGVEITDSFAIPVRDDDGATSSVDAVFNVFHNHAPTLSATLTNPVITETAGDDTFANFTGAMSATDQDTDATFTFGFDEGISINGSWLVDGHTYDVSQSNAFATMYVDSASGQYSIVVDDAAVEALKDTGFLSFLIHVLDNHGASSGLQVADSVYGVNDTPELGAVAGIDYTETAGDDTFANTTGQLSATDRDSGDTAVFGIAGGTGGMTVDGHVYDVSEAGDYGTLCLDSGTGAYVYVPNDAAIEGLKTTATEDFTVTVTDGSSATDSQTLTITLNGVNDTPAITAAPTGDVFFSVLGEFFGVPNGFLPTIALTLIDRDTGNTVTYNTGGLPSGSYFYAGYYLLQGTYGNALLDPSTNTISYLVDPNDADTKALAQGQVVTESFTIGVWDDDGATSSVSADFSVTGVNNAPNLWANLTFATFTDTAGDDTFAHLSGHMSATDPDSDATITFGTAGTTTVGNVMVDGHAYDITATGGLFNSHFGTLYISSTTGDYLYVADDAAMQAAKAVTAESFLIEAIDNHGAIGSLQLFFRIQGANDAPSAVADIGSAGENETKNFNVVANDSDRDAADTPPALAGIVSATSASSVASVNGLDVASLFTIVGNQLHLAPGTTFDILGAGQTATITVTYTISDGEFQAQSTETITVNGAIELVNGTGLDDVLSGGALDDTINGLAGNDHISGGAGKDILNGGDGDDTLDGGGSADTMSGGAGNDTYIVNKAGDVVHENVNEGIDTVSTSLSYVLGANVENLNLTRAGAIDGTGNALDNVINGNGANNTLSGLDGDDVLKGGGGNDSLDGGTGNDTASYADATSGVTVVLRQTDFQDTRGAGSDQLTNIENLTGSRFNDSLGGDDGANILAGGAGNDLLGDLVGNNTLLGGDGDDFLVGGSGNDILSGKSGNDTVSYGYLSAGVGVSVNLALQTAQDTGGGGIDTLQSVENVVGSFWGDTLIGGSGTNLLTGLNGADTLTGGAGGDGFVYDSVAESTGAGYDSITDISFTSDTIYLPFAVTGVDARIKHGALSTASFDTDLAASVDAAHLGAGHAVVFLASAGSLSGETFLVVDANGIAGYQAGADLVIHLQNGVNTNSLDVSDFAVMGM